MSRRNVKVHKYNNSEPLSLMTVKEINEFTLGGTHSLYAPCDSKGRTQRIVQARTHRGIIQGRTLNEVEWIDLEGQTCPQCRHPVESPARIYEKIEGEKQVMCGCTNYCHTGHLSGIDKDWHQRPEASIARVKQVPEY